ncbi:MAG: ATP-binding protein [Betaproteobacteria bacterium]|nr:ATP-binding protein [Betaproteobacteria bacterium]
MSELRRLLAALGALALAVLTPRLPRQTECDAVLARALATLKPQLDAAGASVHGGSLPTVRADPRQLERVFRVLIGNAVRHCGEEPPIIHVSARPAGREWLFAVRDNGVGIDPEDHFAVFNPLDGARELPAARMIVVLHGGRMWVESARGQGATFHFTLPATRGSGVGM